MEIKPFKMRVTPEQSRIVQQTLFNNNHTWLSGDTTIKKLSSPHLYFYEDILSQTEDFQETFFIEHELPELTFQEFFYRYVKWCIKISKENKDIIYQWLKNRYNYTYKIINGEYIYNDGLWAINIIKNSIELTFEQFKQYVLKTKDMEKKIIGYRLKEDCTSYKDAIYEIAQLRNFETFENLENITTKELIESWEEVKNKLIKAGVLDLWFEPVFYQETSKELYFGKVKFTIKKGDNFATTEYGKVTKEEISKVFEYFNNPPALICGKYQLKLDLYNDYEIKFGCQSGTLGELRAIYKEFE